MQGRFLFLGTGGSMGVPVIGCPCSVCHSQSPYNKRLRSSGLVTIQDRVLLIDAGPDFREQALKFNIGHLNGVLLTHPHFDHVGGVDDLRAFYFIQHKRLPCLLSEETMDDLKKRYHYMLRPLQEGKSISAQLDFQILENDFGNLVFEGVNIHYMTFAQAGTKVTGFRIGSLAYVSDIREYTEELFLSLKGIKTLVLSALRQVPTPMHFSIDEAVVFAKQVGAEQTYLTHIAHDLDYAEVSRSLPSSIYLSYDGLEILFEISSENLL
jgi:phosphoribosyl 1,2-cyclic phosphate phosphodiesterase